MAKKSPVILLVTAATPSARIQDHKNYLAERYKRQPNEITVMPVDATYEKPSELATTHDAWLFADVEVSLMAPNSLKLAHDMGLNWSTVYVEGGTTTIPLLKCKKEPRWVQHYRGRRRR